MKTLVRIQEYSDKSFNHMVIQLLYKPFKNSDNLSIYGELSFQQNIEGGDWYGLRFNVSTNNHENLSRMARLAKYIKNNCEWNSQPEDVLSAIGAVRHKVFKNDFIEVSREGEYMYDVITPSGSLYKRIVAPNEKKARLKLKDCPEGSVLKYNNRVIF